MNPSMCRQVFVDERASNTAAAGTSNQGAAMVMGHSEQQCIPYGASRVTCSSTPGLLRTQ